MIAVINANLRKVLDLLPDDAVIRGFGEHIRFVQCESQSIQEAQQNIDAYLALGFATNDLGAAKARLKELVTVKRREIEAGGLMLPGDVRVLTAKADQDRVSAAVLYLRTQPEGARIDFKSGNGWVRLDQAQLEAMAQAIGAHVQACFSAEKRHHETIDGLGSLREAAIYDWTVWWPEQSLESQSLGGEDA